MSESKSRILSRYDKSTLEWIEQKTIQNMLLQCNGRLNKLKPRQIRFLKDVGLVKRKRRLFFTAKGLEFWEELKNEQSD